MCKRFTSILSPEVLESSFGVPAPLAIEPRYNIAPSQQVWVVRSVENQNRINLMQWGFKSTGSEGLNIDSHINSCCETVHKEPAFRHAIKHNRCIIPATGFYSWAHIDGSTQPYYTRITNGGAMAIAGLWEQSADGDAPDTFTILTTAANKLVSQVHERMPVILSREGFGLWLNTNINNTDQLQHLYLPFPEDMLTMYRVPDLVNNTRFDAPACLVQV